MATAQTVATAIQGIINPVVTDLIVDNNPVNVVTGIGWPPEKALQNNVKGVNSIISIYDRKMARNTTRWKPLVLSSANTATALTSTVSHGNVPAGNTATITLGGSVVAGDAVSAVLVNGALLSGSVPNSVIFTNSAAQVIIATSGATLASMAFALAAAINTDPLLSLWVHAVATGPVVTLTSLLALGTLNLQSNVGSGGTNLREIGRRERHYQVVIWSPTSDIRAAITSAVETVLQQTELVNWVQFPDDTSGRLFNQNDYDLEDATLMDTYRHDFLFSVDYPITENDQLYSVLAPIVQYEL